MRLDCFTAEKQINIFATCRLFKVIAQTASDFIVHRFMFITADLIILLLYLDTNY